MKVLIVGAGAVGTVYGRHFQMAGAEVSFLVREKYAEACHQGFTFYLMNRSRSERYKPVRMKNFGILTRASEVANQKWDYVVLAMSSTALRGSWLEELIQAMGSAILVTLQPGLEDREYILERLSEDRLIEGMIPIVSYIAPLPGETVPEPGIACWFPPGSSGPFSGPKPYVRTLVKLLKKGGFPARMSRDVRQEALIPSMVLTLMIAALEASGWSFQKLMKGSHLKLACQAIPEALQVVTRRRGVRAPIFLPLLLKPITFKTVIILSRWLVPFDFETYLRVHFTKVQEQMHQALKDFVDLSHEYLIPVPSLLKLQKKVVGNG